MDGIIDFTLYSEDKPEPIGEAVDVFKYKDFTEINLTKRLTKIFKLKGYNLISVKKPRSAKKVGGVSVFDTKCIFDNGLKLNLLIRFQGHGKRIKPNDVGIIYEAKFGTTKISLARAKGDNLSFFKMVKVILKQMDAALPKELEKYRKKLERQATRNQNPAPRVKGVNAFAAQKAEIDTQLEQSKKQQEDLENMLVTSREDLTVKQTTIDQLQNEDNALTQQIDEKQKELDQLKAS